MVVYTVVVYNEDTVSMKRGNSRMKSVVLNCDVIKRKTNLNVFIYVCKLIYVPQLYLFG